MTRPPQAWPQGWTPQRRFGEGRVAYGIDADGVAVLGIDVPARMNALDDVAVAGIVEALETAEQEARVIVFTGLGGRAFISGADIGGFDGPKREGPTFLDGQQRLAACPLPVPSRSPPVLGAPPCAP